MALTDIVDTSPGDDEATHSARRSIQMISVIGTLPFVGLTLAIILFGARSGLTLPLTDALKIYATLVLSFLGGIRWGLVLAEHNSRNSRRTIVAALIAPGIGWASVFLSGPIGFAFLIVAFAGQGAWDNFAAHNGRLPRWFAKSRMILTGISSASLAITMYAIA